MEGVQGRHGTLSRRELEIAALVAEGLTNRAIAARMFISERTVDSHLEHIREKLGVGSRAQVATWFVSQSQPVVAPAAAARVPLARRATSLNLWLPIAAVAVVALVAGAVLYERLTPMGPDGPVITDFKSVNPADRFFGPWSVTVAGDGSVYIADTGTLSIRKVDPKLGSITTFAGGIPGEFIDGSDRLNGPVGFVTGVATAPNGTLYFATHIKMQGQGPGMVARIDRDGTMHYVAGARNSTDRSGPMNVPAGLAFAPDGTLYIADLIGNQIWKRSSGGALTLFAGNGQEGFSGDGGAATDAKLDRPRALAVESDGDVLVADTGNNRIREISHGSNVIETVAGTGDYYGFSGDGGPATRAKLSLPWGVAISPDGTIYVADAGNDRVRSINAKGIITTLVHAGLSAPGGVAVTPTGYLYVVDLGDPWLHRVDLSPAARST